jgi:seryl-tRNA synthetase
MNEFVITFTEVERNLDSVSARQHIIRAKSNKAGDLKADHKARIDSEIKAINVLMDQTNKKLRTLYSKLKLSDTRNIQLEKTVVLLNNQLNNKYAELAELNERLRKANAQMEFMEMTVEILEVQNMEQAQVINDKANELHTGYYIVAESSDLQKWELIDKQGGFLGIGQTSKLSNNMDMTMFTKINILETTSIPVNSKGIKIVTTHPTGSFSLNKTGRMVNSILISDPEKFWSASKYLVITK